MPALSIRFLFAVWLVLAGFLAMAGIGNEYLRVAARAHRGGETGEPVAIWKAWAVKGNIDAAYNLAVIQQYGDGVPLDYTAAMYWYRQPAEHGDKVSQYQTGLMYHGQGVVADDALAQRWFAMHR
ncbi:MAG: sel1 repeat family protein [Dechloromonas sp.]|nr:sel1 repeat family protein [Dechloromonas sp.]